MYLGYRVARLLCVLLPLQALLLMLSHLESVEVELLLDRLCALLLGAENLRRGSGATSCCAHYLALSFNAEF